MNEWLRERKPIDRTRYVIMGTMCALFMAPWGLFWYRDRPEVYGLKPDGEDPDSDVDGGDYDGTHVADEKGVNEVVATTTTNNNNNNSSNGNRGAVEGNDGEGSDADDDGEALRTTRAWTAKEALRTPTFWAFAMCSLSMSLTGTAFWFHLKEVLADAELTDSVQVRAVGACTVSSAPIDRQKNNVRVGPLTAKPHRRLLLGQNKLYGSVRCDAVTANATE